MTPFEQALLSVGAPFLVALTALIRAEVANRRLQSKQDKPNA
jgi:hypothetical protein